MTVTVLYHFILHLIRQIPNTQLKSLRFIAGRANTAYSPLMDCLD
jgi:hypothetical protein